MRWLLVLLTLGLAAGLFVLACSGRYQARGLEESAAACGYRNVVLVLDTWTGRVSCELVDDNGTVPKDQTKPDQPQPKPKKPDKP